MNNLINRRIAPIIGIILLLSVVSGCKKFLNQAPENSITKDNFFKTKSDAETSIISCYDALQACTSQFLNWGEFRGDLITSNGNNNVTYPYYEYMDNTLPVSNWSVVYTLIGRVNTVIENVPDILKYDNDFTKEESNQIIAEALFLRSLAYFYLVRTFKDVPLVLQAPSNDRVDFFLPKTSADSVLDQVEKDLDTAEKYVPIQYSSNALTRGRATKGAVNALQADVYLWRDKYTLAIDAAQKVIDNKGLYNLVPGNDWFTIFSLKNSGESIFEVEYDASIGETNGLIGTVGNFSASQTLTDYFKNDEGEDNVSGVRGLNKTYISGNSFWKYSGLNSSSSTNVSRSTNDPNFIVYRLSGIMLLQAEALVNVSDGDSIMDRQKALNILDTIRARGAVDIYDYLDGHTPKGLLMNLILKERAMELATEGKRWFDLVRVGKRDNYANADLLINNVVQSRNVGIRAQIKSRIVDPRSWYMPIYQDELNKNPKLKQNPYYSTGN
ncbi:RagB/SusD family nutrient uptake outer membrane protein [Arachidicoccus sp.]|uniref:RagB/SusD family nutrient uptake outer membrane protein n=1 Tax=Arachidicoccus sp. TaxID=1872624 RepID=UPI003D1993B0